MAGPKEFNKATIKKSVDPVQQNEQSLERGESDLLQRSPGLFGGAGSPSRDGLNAGPSAILRPGPSPVIQRHGSAFGPPNRDVGEINQSGTNFGRQNFAAKPLYAASRLPIQPKLQVGPANDKYEQEADQMAAQVMRMPSAEPGVQRDDLDEEDLQMKSLSVQRAEFGLVLRLGPISRNNCLAVAGKALCRVICRPILGPKWGRFQRGADSHRAGGGWLK